MGEPSVAIALGAGGARGLAHVHALEALDELGITPTAISGTSMGAIMGAGYASGLNGEEIQAYIRERFRNRFKLLADLWRTRPDTVREFITEGGPRVGEINIERVLDLFLPETVARDFADLKIPFQVVATDYYGQCDKVFSSGSVYTALAASAAVPAVFRPLVVDDTVLIDGGMTNPVPFDLLEDKADIIVAVDACGGPRGPHGKRPRKIDVVYASSQLLQLSITREKRKCHRLDIYIRADVAQFRVLDFHKTKSILDTTEPMKDELKRSLEKAFKAREKAG